ncbi:polymorphic toxin type 15 domain-containing protein, partial [Chitinivorax sp. B]|uniref:polymorphic toxin type 15 domain-containing protein n=1 Tax=Chitinivorax sp. B TaxID=2502235 RepID=UPI0020172A22
PPVGPPRTPEVKVPCFKADRMPRHKLNEFDRQLKGQQDGLNDLTVDEFLKGRELYEQFGRTADPQVAERARLAYQAKLENEELGKHLRNGLSPREARQLARQVATNKMKALAALHNPDMYTGGKDKIADFGDAKVNKSIGAQWGKSLGKKHPEWDGDKGRFRVHALDEAAQKILPSLRATTNMNATLTRCK